MATSFSHVFGPRQQMFALVAVCLLLLSGVVAPVVAVPPDGPDEGVAANASNADATDEALVTRTATTAGAPEKASVSSTGESVSSWETPESTTLSSAGESAAWSPTTTDAASVSAAMAAEDEIYVDTELSLTPGTPGSVGVTQSFDLPSRVVSLTITLPEGVTVTEANRFTKTEPRTWKWTGSGTPSLSYAMEANETAQQGGPLAGSGSYLFADTGDWALVRRPSIGLRWQQQGAQPIEVIRSADVEGQGVVGGETAFLGPHDIVTERAHGQTFKLVVPAAAEMAEDEDAVFEALTRASGTLNVGDRDEEVFIVVAPTENVDWAVQGLQVGDRDMWVGDDQRVADVENVWVHEYVHTRQSFTTDASAQWLVEATATWYAARFSLREGDISYGEFSSFLERGEGGPAGRSVLAEPSTWESSAQYLKGSLVVGDTDRRIRVASDGTASMQTVIRWLNGRSEPVSNDDFLQAVADAGGSSVRSTTEQHTTTSEAPDMWGQQAHAAAFESIPARMQVVADVDGVRVESEFREGPIDSPLVVATGESLTLPVSVENTGGLAGEYLVVLRVNDEVADTAEGSLEPDESTDIVLSHTFDEPGSYTLSVAGEMVDVTVKQPANLQVSKVTAAADRVTQGDRVEVTAVVENTDAVPGSRELEFVRNGEVVATREVTLAPGESTEVTANVQLPEAGTHRVGAGRVTVKVTVEEGSGRTNSQSADSADSSVSTPGFGLATALVALLVVALFGRFRP